MKTIALPTDLQEVFIQEEILEKKERIVTYYQEAGPDYGAWSKHFNMHFGYWKWGINPMNRESMLEQLNSEVFQRLKVDQESAFHLADLGCGLGATLRHGTRNYPRMSGTGITIVPWQIQQAKALFANSGQLDRVELTEADYCQTPLPDQSVDAVVAIESSCYADGDDKAMLLKEIRRILKPGGRFVISDGFLKRQVPTKGFLRRAYDQLCHSWALPELADVNAMREKLQQLGFNDVETEEISLRVAPSVAHVPFTVISFLIKQVLFGKQPMTKERWDNLKSPILTMVLGSARRHFGYYLVSGRK